MLDVIIHGGGPNSTVVTSRTKEQEALARIVGSRLSQDDDAIFNAFYQPNNSEQIRCEGQGSHLNYRESSQSKVFNHNALCRTPTLSFVSQKSNHDSPDRDNISNVQGSER